jgi:drug/metabolite transporter (DMT)-like permease
MSVAVKHLAGQIPFLEMMFFRCACAMPVVMLIVLRSRRGGGGLAATLRTRRFPGHALRAVTGTLAMGCSFFALGLLPLAEHQALTSTTPLFVTLLSIPILGEKVGPWRLGAVLAGFFGILVIALGQGAFSAGLPEAAQIGLVVALMHGVFSAGTTLMVRSLSATEASTTIVMWQSLLMSALMALALPFVWVTPTLAQIGLLVLIGVIGAVGQVLLTEAWASAQVSLVAPFSYSSLLWAVLLGWLAFGEVPSFWTVAGALIIVAAGLFILHREIKRRRP